MTVTLSPVVPPVDLFIRWRADEGWGTLARDTAERALAASLYAVSAMDGDRLVGIGRLVGDGAVYVFLEDIIVHPDYQGQGVGRLIVEHLVAEAKAMAGAGATIALLAAPGK
ncbi:MAG: GNAT family N-acetyltransferase, partial [Pseudomonadota bacterium]